MICPVTRRYARQLTTESSALDSVTTAVALFRCWRATYSPSSPAGICAHRWCLWDTARHAARRGRARPDLASSNSNPHPLRVPSEQGCSHQRRGSTRCRRGDSRQLNMRARRPVGVGLSRVGEGIRTRRPRWCCTRSWRWRVEQPGEGRYVRCPSQRTVTPRSSATRNSGSPVSTGQSSTDAAPAAKASA